jgi:hypothetical protein
MLRFSTTVLNFFPLGMRTGPRNAYMAVPAATNYDTRLPVTVKDVKRMRRDQLTLDCPMCRFMWDHETLTVHCPSDATHKKREHWLAHDWMWGKQQPTKYYKAMPVTFNPRTHQFMADEAAKSMNNERRGQGLTTRIRNLAKQQRGISGEYCGIGKWSRRWSVHFPYPV